VILMTTSVDIYAENSTFDGSIFGTTMTTVYRDLALRTEEEIRQTLNRMIKGSSAANPALGGLLGSPAHMLGSLREAAPDIHASGLISPRDDSRAARAALILAGGSASSAAAQGHGCLAHLAQGTVCKILDQEEVKPHEVRYYLEQRDPDFAEKMAEVLWFIAR
jgi:hypothetical protein